MNSLNDEVCEYNSEPVTENFIKVNCVWPLWMEDKTCPDGCRSRDDRSCYIFL